jgi:glycerol uptake facilitator-like aquaporin
MAIYRHPKPLHFEDETILSSMSPFPKPRDFWDYALFALVMTGLLLLLFWVYTSDRLRWTDILLAATAAALFVLGAILVRQRRRNG